MSERISGHGVCLEWILDQQKNKKKLLLSHNARLTGTVRNNLKRLEAFNYPGTLDDFIARDCFRSLK